MIGVHVHWEEDARFAFLLPCVVDVNHRTKFELIDQRAVRLPLRIHTYLSLGGLQTLESSSLSSAGPNILIVTNKQTNDNFLTMILNEQMIG